MPRSSSIDTLSAYYRTLRTATPKHGNGPPSRVLEALSEPGELGFDQLRQATRMAAVDLADVLRTLEDLELVKVGDDQVVITPDGKRLTSTELA